MEAGFEVLRKILKRVLPQPVRAALRRALYPARFHLHPAFSRYTGPESVVTWAAYEIGFHLWRRTWGRGARLARPIFLIGCPRSGTTIAVDLFALHPEVANLSEAPEIWDPRGYEDFEADHHWAAADVRPEDAARLHARFEYHRRWHGKPRFVNKYPRSSVRIDYLRAVFPDAVFIHVMRDGRAVAASMLQALGRRRRGQVKPDMPFTHPPGWRGLIRQDKAEQVALQWGAVVGYILSKRAELGSAYHEIRYEELCAHPRAALGAAFRFAGLRADEEVLARIPERLDNQNYKWKQQLSLQQVETITRAEAALLEELGYSV
jgi:hypothetical protein